MPRTLFFARAVVIAMLAMLVVSFVWVVAGRLTYPFELEWMTGSILDHIERVREGLPVYTEPSAGFVPFLYPPLYYWVSATLGGSVLVCRLLSLASLGVQLACAYRIARALDASKFWSGVASALVIACFGYVGWWYDLERTDTFHGAFALAAAYVLIRAKGPLGHIAAGAILGLAILAKQQAAFYAAGGAAGLLLAWRVASARIRDAVLFTVTAGATMAVALVYTSHREGPWFAYYVYKMPRAHGVMLSLAGGLVRDAGSGFVLFLVTFGVSLFALNAIRKKSATREELIFAAFLAFGFAGAVGSRLHIGGWINVLQPWTTFACIATAVVCHRIEARYKHERLVPPILAAILGAQFYIWSYDPGQYCPTRKASGTQAGLATFVDDLEKQGDVLIPARGHLTKTRHFHISAMADVIRVDGHPPKDLVDKLNAGAFAAVIDDAREAAQEPPPDWPPVLLEELEGLREPLLRHYFIAERLDDDVAQMPLPSPARAVWVYRPRRNPLENASKEELRARQLVEMRLAWAKMYGKKKGHPLTYDGAEIEELAGKDPTVVAR